MQHMQHMHHTRRQHRRQPTPRLRILIGLMIATLGACSETDPNGSDKRSCEAPGCDAPAESALDAFQRQSLNCPETYAAALAEVEAATECHSALYECEGYDTYAYEYGFTGDNVRCHYAEDGVLVGAVRTSDHGTDTVAGDVPEMACYAGTDCPEESADSEGAGGAASLNDYETLLACTVATPCADESSLFDASAQYADGNRFSMSGMDCVLAALRDRTPGRYTVRLSHAYGDGNESAEHALVVAPDGTVERAELEHTASFETLVSPSERCALKPSQFFDDCLAAYNADRDSDAAWACVFPKLGADLPWFQGCRERAPSCD